MGKYFPALPVITTPLEILDLINVDAFQNENKFSF